MLKPSAAPPRYQCSSESAMSAAVPQIVRWAREPVAPGHLDDELLPPLLGIAHRHLGQRSVESKRRKVHPDNVAGIFILKKLGMIQSATVGPRRYDSSFLKFDKTGK